MALPHTKQHELHLTDNRIIDGSRGNSQSNSVGTSTKPTTGGAKYVTQEVRVCKFEFFPKSKTASMSKKYKSSHFA